MLKRVYVIDDDPITLYLTQVVFEIFTPETRCESFESTALALGRLIQDAAEGALPDLVLLDLNMPLMDGFELLERLAPQAEAFREQSCPIYVLTSSVDKRDRLRSLSSPLVRDVLEKPFSQEKLEKILTIAE